MARSRSESNDHSSVPGVDKARAVKLVMEMMAIPGKSGHEGAISAFIIEKLRQAGVPDSCITRDTAHKKSELGGECGNLIVKLPGTLPGPRRLLMAHIDTVPLCVGAKPKKQGEFIVSADQSTALGGDNRAGAAVVLQSILTLLEKQTPHPPLTLFWPVQEEVGLVGARHVGLSKLGGPKFCFNWDGGSPQMAVIGATGADHLDIDIQGIASHAGAHPEVGVSAAVIAGVAIADLQQNGWHGLVVKGKEAGTSNIGSLHGGEATNVVLERLQLTAEVRSHNPKFRQKIVTAYQQAFTKAAKQVQSSKGATGSVTIKVRDKYESFRLPESEPVVQMAMQAITAHGLVPETRVVNGGLDANWMTRHGLSTVTLGCGQDGIHTVNETLHIESFLHACQIALHLAVG
ncbi:MAG: M20/M25/M40 family metallo-hydrolase [Planctomycetaceae bacterium]